MTDKHETDAIILAGAIGSLLEENEGVIVHHEGKGYFVVMVWNEEEKTYVVGVEEDEAFLQAPNYQKVFMREEDDETNEDLVEIDKGPTLQ